MFHSHMRFYVTQLSAVACVQPPPTLRKNRKGAILVEGTGWLCRFIAAQLELLFNESSFTKTCL